MKTQNIPIFIPKYPRTVGEYPFSNPKRVHVQKLWTVWACFSFTGITLCIDMAWRCYCGLDYLPVCFVAILSVSILTSFTIAVAQSDVFPWFPTISDTATKSPESNIFSQLVNIGSFVGFLLAYVRYLQVQRDVESLDGGSPVTVPANRWGLLFGLIAVFGISIVANFPEKQVLVMHLIGALVSFLCGNIYVWIQVIISFQMRRSALISFCVYLIRIGLSVVSTVSFVLCMVMISCSASKYDGNNLKWDSDDPGYTEHVIADVSEWVMVFAFLGQFLTFIKEFSKSRLQIKLVSFQDHHEPLVVDTSNIYV